MVGSQLFPQGCVIPVVSGSWIPLADDFLKIVSECETRPHRHLGRIVRIDRLFHDFIGGTQ